MYRSLHDGVVTAVRKIPIHSLNVEREEFASILMKIGLKRNVAKVLTYLAGVEEATSREIEMGSDLRQPEVSIAMRTLRDNNWIEEKEIKREGKGRPMKVYSLKAGIEEVIKHFEEEKLHESAQAMESIQRLKQLIST